MSASHWFRQDGAAFISDDDSDEGNLFGSCLKCGYADTGEIIVKDSVLSLQDAEVQFDFYWHGSVATWSQRFTQIALRVLTGSSNNGYFLSYGNASDFGHLKIYKRTAGVFTELADGGRVDIASDVKYRLFASAIGATLYLEWVRLSDSFVMDTLSVVDATYGAAGAVGLRNAGSATNASNQSHHITNFRVDAP